MVRVSDLFAAADLAVTRQVVVKGMRIATLIPSYANSTSPFKDHDPVCDAGRWLTGCPTPARAVPAAGAATSARAASGAHARPAPDLSQTDERLWAGVVFEEVAIEKATAGAQIRDLVASRSFDAFVNLCDGAWDEDRPGIDVVRLLEQLDVPFTGAASHFYEPSREHMKMVCRYWGVRTPEYAVCRSEQDALLASKQLHYPLIVKHENSYGSIGMTAKSRVTTEAELLAEVQRFCDDYGSALVEEFIEGDEYTCLVAESVQGPPISYASVRCRFPPGETFKHFALKWEGYEGMAWEPCADSALDARIREASCALFTGLGGTGYGRTDVRVDAAGNVYVLEINPNCGLVYPDGAFGSADEILFACGGHRAFLSNMLRVALHRHEQRRPVFKLHYRPNVGYEMVAARALAAGHVIQQCEERKLAIASSQHTSRWTGLKAQWFRQYAWPIASNVHVLWDDHPSGWKPINHSCDPNAWMSGLNMIARRAIAADEPIVSAWLGLICTHLTRPQTIDYATFCGENMEPFDCQCGSTHCRGAVKGTDALLPELRERYAGHCSPFVEQWQAERAK